ncbi:MAG: metallophosphoesterase [Clostridium baratii]|uniref:metallophosphoesterase n=1 Tax=Clostridium baratii TaxID=1561 RepID=UPI00242FC47F|nr:metallophosphoesterase [Clostridium baratii]MBS6007509.1 metallophosphoesterase [Clostridium baratii]MDU1054864.1 metallophosphoesterase [Clostridium baratii]
MLIAVVSDTHRIDRYIDVVKKKIASAEILIHLGDNVDDVEKLSEGFKGEVYAVLGNCDYSSEYPIERVIDINGVKIFATHGHNYNVKYGLNNIYYKTKEVGADIGLFGHTHQELIIRENGILLMNPGSPSLPRGRGRSIGFITINEEKEIEARLECIE